MKTGKEILEEYEDQTFRVIAGEVTLEEMIDRELSKAMKTRDDLIKVLEPFAKFSCDDWETHGCHNCIAKRAIKKALGESK